MAKGYVVLQDWFGATSRYSYEMIAATVGQQLTDLAAIADLLAALTNATVVSATISAEATISPPVAAVSNSNLSDVAVLSCYINPTKTAVLKVPAPKENVFLPNTKVVDVNNGALQAFVQAVAAFATVSDGESIDVGLGTSGIKSGALVSSARS